MSSFGGRGVAAALLVLAGCANSEVDPLAVGQSVIFYDGTSEPVKAWVDRGGSDPVERFQTVDVSSGTRGQVIEDEPGKPPVQPLLRLVKVRMVDGGTPGVVVELARNKLRPSE